MREAAATPQTLDRAAELQRAVAQYVERGWQLVVLRPREKRPLFEQWSTNPPSVTELLSLLDGRDDCNLGVLLGAPSGGLVDVDLDAPEARTLAAELLPKTGAVFGRRSAPGSHRLYLAEPLPKSETFRGPDGRVLLELRSAGRQTMLPPSQHPSGEIVTWENDAPPAKVRAEELRDACARLAAAALLVRYWPQPGSRQEAALALAGGLARLGWGVDSIATFVRIVAEAANDEEARKRAAAAVDTATKHREGLAVTGWRRLAELLGHDVVRVLRQWLQPPTRQFGPYRFGPEGIAHLRTTEHGVEERLLANFTAEISEVLVLDDGAETHRVFVVEGRVGDQPLPPLRVPAERFANLTWTADWAPRAVVSAGPVVKDRLREAVQLASVDAPERIVFAHTGWREVDGRFVFLHAAGALGSSGPLEHIQVELPPELRFYTLGTPPDLETLRAAVTTVWHDLPRVAPEVIPALFGAVLTAPLATILEVDVAIWVSGSTGLFKTSTVSLLLNTFGMFPPTTAPVSFESTANFLEKLAFLGKDLPLCIDDVRPPQTSVESAEWRAKMERLLRAVGNRAGRGRLASDTSLRPTYPPRALVILTGEDDPAGASALSRTLLVRFRDGTVNPEQLAHWQRNPEPLRIVGAGFIHWLAGVLEQKGAEVVRKLRDELPTPTLSGATHPRLARALRQLMTGWGLFAWFATEVGAVSADAAGCRLKEVEECLVRHALDTGEAVTAARPGRRFVVALGELFASRRAHLAGRNTAAPPGCVSLGWTPLSDDTVIPGGERIGWADEEFLFLIPGVARSLVARLLREAGEVFAISARRLLEELEREGVLVSAHTTTRTSVMKVAGRPWRVWVLDRAAVEAVWAQGGDER